MLARIRDTEIYFDVDGSSLLASGSRLDERLTALISHGGPGIDHTAGKVGYAPLSKKLQLVYFDYRGQGRSARGDPQKYTLDENAEDIEALREYLGLKRIVSIGTSYGAMVAMAHASRYPTSVSHLVLVVAAAHSGYIARAKELAAARGTPEQIAMCDELFSGRIDTREKLQRYFEVMRSLYTRRRDLPVAPIQSTIILEPLAGNMAYGKGGYLHKFDLRPQLGAIIAPTLIIAGRHDWISAPEFSEEIHGLIPGSDLRIFEESAHTISIDEPEKLLDAIAGFLVYNSKSRPQDDDH